MCEKKGKTRFRHFEFVSPIKQAPMYDEKGKIRFRQFGFVSPIKQAPMCDEKGKTRFRLFGFVSSIKQAPSMWKIEELVVERKTRMNKKFSCLV